DHAGQSHRPAEHPDRAYRHHAQRSQLGRRAAQPGGPGPRVHDPGGHHVRPQPRPGGTTMTWLTWRQFRIQTWVALAALAILATTLAITGPNLAHLYATSGLASCHDNCETMARSFLATTQDSGGFGVLYYLGIGVVFIVPALVGVFWGAPL